MNIWFNLIVYTLALWKIGDLIGWDRIKKVIREFMKGSERKEQKETKEKHLNTNTNCNRCGKNSYGKPLCIECWKKENGK